MFFSEESRSTVNLVSRGQGSCEMALKMMEPLLFRPALAGPFT